VAIQFEVRDDDRTLRVTDTAEREQFDLSRRKSTPSRQ
jgi:hypothetical protein